MPFKNGRAHFQARRHIFEMDWWVVALFINSPFIPKIHFKKKLKYAIKLTRTALARSSSTICLASVEIKGVLGEKNNNNFCCFAVFTIYECVVHFKM